MTAMNIVKRRDEIILITDGAAYSDDGALLAIASKVNLLPNFSGFVMQSGGSAWTPAIVSMFEHCAFSTDNLFDVVEWLVPEIETKYAGISSVPMGRILFGGWSEARGQMRLGAVFSENAANLDQGHGADVIQPDAYKLQEFDGDQLLCQPPISDRDWIEGFGSMIYDVRQIDDVEKFASFVLTSQKQAGAPHRGVGGFGQITRITKDETITKIFERYEDAIGEVMYPIPADWNAWRAKRAGKVRSEAAVVSKTISGLSRQQRRALEAKNRKLKVV